jgi:ABC-type uncharacterized transport system substrate-binding protein
LRNHCCRGKSINIAYSDCVSVALIILHAMAIRHIVICVLFDVAKPTKYTSYKTSTVFYHSSMYTRMMYARVVSLVNGNKGSDLRDKVTENKTCVLISSINSP